MSTTATAVETATLTEGSVVTILGDNRFAGKQGMVVDTNSDLMPDDGPIAVYFDIEVDDYEFNVAYFQEDKKWKDGVPTKSTYRKCYRVICFRQEELRLETRFPIETIVRRKFGNNFAAIGEFKFPLRPGTHACQFEACETRLPATELTLVNVWGTIMTVYACTECHTKWHGARTDGFKLKSPLPGLVLNPAAS